MWQLFAFVFWFWLGLVLLRAIARMWDRHKAEQMVNRQPRGPTPMQRIFTNEEIGMIAKYRIQWQSPEHARKVIEALKRSGADATPFT